MIPTIPGPPALPSAQSVAAASTDVFASNVTGFGTDGYQGAWSTQQRGYIYWPTLDPQREVSSYSRREIARRAHWCCANLGLARRIKSALVNLIAGTGLTLRATNKDPKFRARAERYFNAQASSRLTYDLRQRITQRRAQRMLVGTQLTDGGALIVRARDSRGAALRAFYSSLAVSGAPKKNSAGWIDGCKLNALEQITHYRFPQRDGSERIIPASYVEHVADIEAFGSIHAPSVFAHAVARMTDITELNASVMMGLKESQRMGYYIAPQLGAPAGPGLEDRLRQGGKSTLTPTDGVSIELKDVFTQGGEIKKVPPGWDLKLLLDQRPHENTREFIWSYIQDIAWGAGIAPELLWNAVKLGSANQNFVMADANTFVGTKQQDLVDQALAPDYIDTIGCGIEIGDLEGPDESIDPDWWAHGWIPPERQTINFSRDGKIQLEQYRAGLITATRMFAMRGWDAYDETEEHLQYRAWRKKRMKQLGLTMAEAYDATPGAAPQQESTGEPAADHEDEEDAA